MYGSPEQLVSGNKVEIQQRMRGFIYIMMFRQETAMKKKITYVYIYTD